MSKVIVSRSGILSGAVSLALVFAVFGIGPATAQEIDPGITIEAHTAVAPAPQLEQFEALENPPALTEEQRAQLEYCTEHTHLPGPALDYNNAIPVTGPMPGTESVLVDERTRSGQPLAPGDIIRPRVKIFPGVIPAGYDSNVMESSVGVGGRYAFYTGNWFAAHSADGGKNWTYVNPYSGFSDFCCDQKTMYDASHSRFIWLRMGSPSGGVNVFKLSVNTSWIGSPTSWYTWTFAPTDVDASWTNQWWDYPNDMQIGADYLYVVWNMFDSGSNFMRTVILRFPLEALASGSGFGYSYWSTDWFTVVPVQGAHHAMYFASNWPPDSPQNSRLRIWRWYEDSGSYTYWDKTVASSWTLTGRGYAHCGAANGNWCYRGDQRVLTGARYSIYTDGITEDRQPGRKVLAWWWNVAEGGGFPYPYADAAAFFEDNMTQLSGNLGRPLIYSGSYCAWYPSVTPNKRQDLGMVIHWATGGNLKPSAYCAIADDYTTAPPGWVLYNFARSYARPSDEKWGDYNTCREFEPSEKLWVGATHVIPGDTDCAAQTGCSAPVYVVFGRERDYWSWHRWMNK